MRLNAHGSTVDQLGQQIVAGSYASGATVPPEPLLCDAFGVSRTVVREAVKSLVAKGLVTTGPKVGTRVQPSEHWNWFDADVIRWQSKVGLTREFLRDLQDLRRVLEPAAARMAAERATAKDIRVIAAAYEGMRLAVEEGGDYVSHDLAFHQGLLRASRNRMVIQMSRALGALLRTSFEISTARKDAPRHSLPLHRAVLDALIAHDAAHAERCSLVLIDGAQRDIETVLAGRRRLPRLDVPAAPLRAA
jgi:DNA-binding FadR family transcriptional regulator